MRAATLLLLAFLLAPVAAAHRPRDGDPHPILRGSRVSGAAQRFAHQQSGGASATSGPATCSAPGGGNYRADCHSGGAPVNEVALAASPDGSLLVAGANDYNSYNGQGQDGYYWSTDGGTTWNDGGPLDVFPHGPNNGAGDPGLAVDAAGVVYYSSIFFGFNSCSVGGVQLLRRDPASGAWSVYQIAANSSSQFQDKPAVAADGTHVFVSWTQFGSCTGEGVASPIRVAVLPAGAGSAAPEQVLNVPGSQYSQGSALAPDGAGGFWLAWEEFPSADSGPGAIELAHWGPLGGWSPPQVVSPPGFRDLPSPLPGFAFRTNSFPALAVVDGAPRVAWASADSGVGRVYLWSGGAAAPVSDTGGDQFFPALAGDHVSFGVTDRAQGTYDWYLAHGGSVTRVSTASTVPSGDVYFGGQFLGDYSGLVVAGGVAHASWTDLRQPGLLGYRMDAMTSAPAPPVPDFALSVSPASQTVEQGNSVSYTVSIDATGGFASPVSLSASGLPLGATFSFNPSPATSTSTLTVHAGASTAPGTYAFTILGLSGGVTRTTTATLVVAPGTAPGFTLAASPSTQTVAAGGAASYGVSITPTGSFSGSVSLSASGLPSGATFAFTPNPATSSSTLTVTTAPASPSGTYTLTILGVSGSLSASTTATLVIPSGGGDFTLSASPSSGTVAQGGSVSYGVSIVPSGGFNGGVSLSASGLPAGATFSYSPNPATSSSTLTVKAGASTPTGTYVLTLLGVSGSLTRSTTVTLAVQAGSAPDFSLSVSPGSQSVARGGTVAYTVTVVPVGGFAGLVSLGASGLPSGAVYSFGPSPTASTSTLTVRTASSTPAGTYTITVYGVSGPLFRRTTATLVVLPPGSVPRRRVRAV